MATATQLAHLTSTIESLEQGLTQARAGAVRSLNSWVEILVAADVPALRSLAKELQLLENLLNSNEATAPQLQQALRSVGQHTTAAAATAEGAAADKIKQLGHLLTDSAAGLG